MTHVRKLCSAFQMPTTGSYDKQLPSSQWGRIAAAFASAGSLKMGGDNSSLIMYRSTLTLLARTQPLALGPHPR